MSDVTKRKLSVAMKGKASAWMKGRKPWNYGLHTSKHVKI